MKPLAQFIEARESADGIVFVVHLDNSRTRQVDHGAGLVTEPLPESVREYRFNRPEQSPGEDDATFTGRSAAHRAWVQEEVMRLAREDGRRLVSEAGDIGDAQGRPIAGQTF